MGEKSLAASRSLVQTSCRLRFPSLAERSDSRNGAPPRPLSLGSGQREGNSAWLGRGTQVRNGPQGKCAYCGKRREGRSRRGVSRVNWAGRSAPFIKRLTKNASPSDAPDAHSASGASNPRGSRSAVAACFCAGGTQRDLARARPRSQASLREAENPSNDLQEGRGNREMLLFRSACAG